MEFFLGVDRFGSEFNTGSLMLGKQSGLYSLAPEVRTGSGVLKSSQVDDELNQDLRWFPPSPPSVHLASSLMWAHFLLGLGFQMSCKHSCFLTPKSTFR